MITILQFPDATVIRVHLLFAFIFATILATIAVLPHVRKESLHQLLDLDLALAVVGTVAAVRRDEDAANDVDDAVAVGHVGDGHAREAVDLHAHDAAPAPDVDGDALVVEQGGKVDVIPRAAPAGLGLDRVLTRVGGVDRLAAVVRVRVQRLVGHDVVLEQGAQVAAAVLGVKQEGVGARAQLLEGPVGGREEGTTARQVRALAQPVLQVLAQLGLLGSQDQRRELLREQLNQLLAGWRRYQKGVDAVSDAIFAVLYFWQAVSNCSLMWELVGSHASFQLTKLANTSLL